MGWRVLFALSFLPLAALAEERPPVPPEFLEFLAEEPADTEGLEEALMSREVERALADAKVQPPRKPREGDDDER
ncbi:MAG: hypothetical protein MUC71_12220 [Steroidobacteraceae bacterium]|jgi:hypothetical protein|nr:hypothetical protein [Steroidobacteraceae bacterium]